MGGSYFTCFFNNSINFIYCYILCFKISKYLKKKYIYIYIMKGLLGCVVVVCLVNERIAKTRKNVVDKEEVLYIKTVDNVILMCLSCLYFLLMCLSCLYFLFSQDVSY